MPKMNLGSQLTRIYQKWL